MSISIVANVYGLTGFGTKVKVGQVQTEIDNAIIIDNPIFYIDSENNGAVYHFFDQNGEEMESVAVGDVPYFCIVDGTPTKDKYYIFKKSLSTDLRWTYYTSGDYKAVTVGTQNGIGKGKSNTTLVMAADDGAYVTDDSNGKKTIWYRIKELNDANTDGANDWYLGSKAEYEALIAARDKDNNPLWSAMGTYDYWSSSEASGTAVWAKTPNNGWQTISKGTADGLIPIRSF